MEWTKILLKIKEIVIYFAKWFFNSGVVTIPSMYLMYKLATYNNNAKPPQTLFYVNMLILFFMIGSMAFTFYKSYSKRKLDNNIDFNPIGHEKQKELSFKPLKWLGINETYPLWIILNKIFVVGFLILSCWIMHDGLATLFVKTDMPTKVFEWFFSILIGCTLYWLVDMIGRGKNLIAYSCFYVLVLFAPLTMNFFHFYNNISQTQRMDTAVKYSHTFVENVKEPIAKRQKEIADSLGQSLKKDIDNLQRKIKNETANINVLPLYVKKNQTTSDNNGYEHTTTKEVEHPDRARIQKKINNYETQISNIQKQTAYNIIKRLEEDSIGLSRAKDLCDNIQLHEERYYHPNTKKEDQLKEKNEIVGNAVELYGALKDNILAKDLKIKTTIDIIRMPDVNRVEGVGELFEFFSELFNPNPIKDIKYSVTKEQSTEVRTLEKRLIIMSLSMSLLIDITPLILGLFVAFTHKKE